jgi:hypothetical protein
LDAGRAGAEIVGRRGDLASAGRMIFAAELVLPREDPASRLDDAAA